MKNLFEDYTIDEVYAALRQAETGSFNEPWIRTVAKNTPGGSSAFGPVQITRGLLEDYQTRFPSIWDNNKHIANKLKDQADLMLHYGNNPHLPGYDEKWDYGGMGYGFTDAEKEQYRKFTKDIMLNKWKNIKNKSYIKQPSGRRIAPTRLSPEADYRKNLLVEDWRGVSRREDPRYYSVVDEYLKSLRRK